MHNVFIILLLMLHGAALANPSFHTHPNKLLWKRWPQLHSFNQIEFFADDQRRRRIWYLPKTYNVKSKFIRGHQVPIMEIYQLPAPKIHAPWVLNPTPMEHQLQAFGWLVGDAQHQSLSFARLFQNNRLKSAPLLASHVRLDVGLVAPLQPADPAATILCELTQENSRTDKQIQPPQLRCNMPLFINQSQMDLPEIDILPQNTWKAPRKVTQSIPFNLDFHSDHNFLSAMETALQQQKVKQLLDVQLVWTFHPSASQKVRLKIHWERLYYALFSYLKKRQFVIDYAELMAFCQQIQETRYFELLDAPKPRRQDHNEQAAMDLEHATSRLITADFIREKISPWLQRIGMPDTPTSDHVFVLKPQTLNKKYQTTLVHEPWPADQTVFYRSTPVNFDCLIGSLTENLQWVQSQACHELAF
jgi:hypothetical protein